MNHARLSPSLDSPLPGARPAATLRILLAEDSPELRRLLAHVLYREGHEVVEARDGAELLEAIAATLIEGGREHFDLIISEQDLPGVPGAAVLAGLRARRRATPFILITGKPKVQADARRLGALILDQPFNLQAIRDAIRQSAQAPRAPATPVPITPANCNADP
jgi:CheY-like chemotaxis protein